MKIITKTIIIGTYINISISEPITVAILFHKIFAFA
jgi:hypothetical protein